MVPFQNTFLNQCHQIKKAGNSQIHCRESIRGELKAYSRRLHKLKEVETSSSRNSDEGEPNDDDGMKSPVQEADVQDGDTNETLEALDLPIAVHKGRRVYITTSLSYGLLSFLPEIIPIIHKIPNNIDLIEDPKAICWSSQSSSLEERNGWWNEGLRKNNLWDLVSLSEGKRTVAVIGSVERPTHI